MIKRISILLLLSLILLFAVAVDAQESTSIMITAELPEVIVSCPPEAISDFVLKNSTLAFGFKELTDELLVPNASVTVSDGADILEVSAVVLNCDSTPEEITVIDVSPSVILDDPIPVPENIEGLAESLSGYAVVNTPAANMRSCDEPTCTRVAVVHGGDSLIVLGRNADESWWYVQAGDIRGWIWEDLIILRGDLSDTPFVRTEGEVEPPAAYVGYTGNPLYDNLTSSGKGICSVQGDSWYLIIGRTANTTWLLIDATCTDGSMARGWLKADNALIRNTGGVFVPIYSGRGDDQPAYMGGDEMMTDETMADGN